MKKFSNRAICGLNKIGDCYIPGDESMLSFSRSQCTSELSRVLEYLPASDFKSLQLLLILLSFLPKIILLGLAKLLEWSPRLPGLFGSPLRLIRIGLRGLIFSLYYGHRPVLDVIDYRVSVYTEDLGKKS